MRIVDLTEAQQLTRERFLAAHWQELAVIQTANERDRVALDDAGSRFETQQRLLRRPALQRNEFDSDPRQLRDNLRKLEALLADCEAPVRRRILLVFGELVSSWQGRFSGESISVVIEVLAGSVRVSVRNASRNLTPAEWTELISARVAALVDAWGIDRRLAGRAWFEFQ